ncbi:cytochrome c3 family protein [Halioxenophilus sp. WMMB6]|uniref:cytochrome c3 family protein n=1 Tax=Halioxenophilus sp. WMMB6 TaxID=3073815 RepID=UPI00295E353D|nr:cytochrome c3 family protein [Halioxenophilus sp. WMMB6]
MRRLTLLFSFMAALLGWSVLAGAEELTLKQQILMPGPLIAGHADIEADCESCHTPFAKESLTERCLACHDDIADDRTSKSGFHGQSPAALAGRCETCHTDHEGREADIVGMMRDNFNHQFTRFPLTGQHQLLTCNQCHNDDQPWRETDSQCRGCHQEQSPHPQELADDCNACHQTNHWQQLLSFDHSQTDFPLHGQHQEVPCNACHLGQQYQFASQQCVDCHRSNDIHLGSNGSDCASCHNEQGWDQLQFNHDDTDFPLRGGHQSLSCGACHTGAIPQKETPTDCFSCHKTDDIHQGQFGQQCQQCHRVANWSGVVFDHNLAAHFPLTGRHEALTCNQCHRGPLSESLPRDCAGCHQADDVHHSADMALCGTCHNTDSWASTNRFDHDLSQFPLLGMHRLVSCQSCHVGNQFNLNDSSCNACHSHQDPHQGGLGNDCSQCHTPNNWGLWQFDHGQQTDFSLTGKHSGLTCNACHQPDSDPAQTSGVCADCHRQRDIHNGEFGDHCDRCHNTSNFFELHFE